MKDPLAAMHSLPNEVEITDISRNDVHFFGVLGPLEPTQEFSSCTEERLELRGPAPPALSARCEPMNPPAPDEFALKSALQYFVTEQPCNNPVNPRGAESAARKISTLLIQKLGGPKRPPNF